MTSDKIISQLYLLTQNSGRNIRRHFDSDAVRYGSDSANRIFGVLLALLRRFEGCAAETINRLIDIALSDCFKSGEAHCAVMEDEDIIRGSMKLALNAIDSIEDVPRLLQEFYGVSPDNAESVDREIRGFLQECRHITGKL